MTPVSAQTPEDVTLARLNDQIQWYSRKSANNRQRFQMMKAITIISAALIPVISTLRMARSAEISAGLGVLIAVVEGILQMNQYHANWVAYRSTAEGLKHEKFLYLAKAGPYRNDQNAVADLAERVEALISQEATKWVTVQSDKTKDDGPKSK